MPFDLQPTLTGTLLELRPMREEDFAALFAVASDPLIWEQHPTKERYKEEIFREFFRSGMEFGGALVAIDLRDGRMIGSSRYRDLRDAESGIEIGWTFLARSHWGGAFNGEMKQLMLQHAFQFVDTVLFFIGPDNLRSRKAVEKIGGEYIGVRSDNTGRESAVYRITAETFLITKKI